MNVLVFVLIVLVGSCAFSHPCHKALISFCLMRGVCGHELMVFVCVYFLAFASQLIDGLPVRIAMLCGRVHGTPPLLSATMAATPTPFISTMMRCVGACVARKQSTTNDVVVVMTLLFSCGLAVTPSTVTVEFRCASHVMCCVLCLSQADNNTQVKSAEMDDCWNIGEKGQALWEGTWYPMTVVKEVGDGKITVHWEDGSDDVRGDV
jgi:hypothetical protein